MTNQDSVRLTVENKTVKALEENVFSLGVWICQTRSLMSSLTMTQKTATSDYNKVTPCHHQIPRVNRQGINWDKTLATHNTNKAQYQGNVKKSYKSVRKGQKHTRTMSERHEQALCTRGNTRSVNIQSACRLTSEGSGLQMRGVERWHLNLFN